MPYLHFKPPILVPKNNFRLKIANFQLKTSNLRLKHPEVWTKIPEFGVSVPNLECQARIGDVNPEF